MYIVGTLQLSVTTFCHTEYGSGDESYRQQWTSGYVSPPFLYLDSNTLTVWIKKVPGFRVFLLVTSLGRCDYQKCLGLRRMIVLEVDLKLATAVVPKLHWAPFVESLPNVLLLLHHH